MFVTSRKRDGRGTILDSRVVMTERHDGICASDHYGVLADVQIIPSPAGPGQKSSGSATCGCAAITTLPPFGVIVRPRSAPSTRATTSSA